MNKLHLLVRWSRNVKINLHFWLWPAFQRIFIWTWYICPAWIDYLSRFFLRPQKQTFLVRDPLFKLLRNWDNWILNINSRRGLYLPSWSPRLSCFQVCVRISWNDETSCCVMDICGSSEADQLASPTWNLQITNPAPFNEFIFFSNLRPARVNVSQAWHRAPGLYSSKPD